MEKIRCDKCGKTIKSFDTPKYLTLESASVSNTSKSLTFIVCSECANKMVEWINDSHNKENK